MAFFLSATAQSAPQSSTPAPAPAAQPALRISLQMRQVDGKLQAIASDHVFKTGDMVQFRVESEFDGYLYVVDQGSSGRFTTVFPTAQAGADNRVRQGQSFSIP